MNDNKRAAAKEFKAICKRHKLTAYKPLTDQRFCPWEGDRMQDILYSIHTKGREMLLLEVRKVKGPYQSHRRGYADSQIRLAMYDHPRRLCYTFLYRGTEEEARKMVKTSEFKADMMALVAGRDHITMADRCMC